MSKSQEVLDLAQVTYLEKREGPEKCQKKMKAGFRYVIGSFNLAILLFAILLAVFCGFLIAYGLHVTLSVIDEVLLYGDLYIKNENITLYPCIDQVPAPFTVNESVARQTIEIESNSVRRKLLIILGGYIISSLLAQSLWTVTLFRMMKKVRFGLFHQLLNKELSWYDTHPSTELTPLMTDYPVTAEEGLEKHLFICFEYFGLAVSSIVFSYVNSLVISVALILPMIAIFIIIFAVSKVSAKRVRKSELFTDKAISIAEEVLSSIRTVIAYGGKDFALQKYVRTAVGYSKNIELSSKSLSKLNLLFVFAYSFLMFIANATFPILFGVGYVLLKNCFSTVEENAQVIIFYGLAAGSIFRGFSRLSVVVRSFDALKMISEAFEVSLDKNKRFDHNVDEGMVKFCNVSFTYPSRPDVTVLHGVDFQVESGKSVAIIGPSGCGKTTIIKLLLGLYESYDGSITVDYVDLQYIDPLAFRKQIGLVSQEPILFNVSVYENICYGNPNAEQHMIENAAKLANIHDFILDLPDGYNTIVGEGGIKLSGGQKQRVAIARALVRNPKILLLDEATSALDNENEKTVQEALNNAMRGRTTITIAHRLSTVRNADVIIGIENGYIVERGTHDELMDKEGLYFNLMMKQQQQEISSNEDIADLAVEELVEDSIQASLNDQNEYHMSFKHQHRLNPRQGFLLLMRKYKVALFVIFGCIFIGVFGFLLVFVLYFMIFSTEKLIEYQMDGNTLMPIVLIVIQIVLAITLSIVVFISIYVIISGGEKFVVTLRYDMLKAMMKRGVSWFDRPDNAVGILITNLTVNPSALHQILGYPLLDAVEAIFAFLTVSVLIFFSLWRIALIIVPLISIIIISQILYLAVTWTVTPKLKKITESYGKIAVESIKHVIVVKSLGINDSMESLYKEHVLKEERLKILLFVLRSILQSFGIPILLSSYIIVLWVLFDELLTGSNVINATHVDRQYLRIITMISVFCAIYKSALTALPRFQDAIMSGFEIAKLIFSQPHKEKEDGKGVKPEHINKTISFCNVGFTYPSRSSVPVLTDLNISVEEGQTLAIVGASGSGKTTIVSLLERFYDPSSGVIRLGDHDISDLDIDWLRQQISLVSQDPVLFNMSIADNIRYGALHRTVKHKEIVEAAQTAQIHEFILSLPQGYETIVGLRGHQLSGGQKQRVAIARAVIQDPKILLLDEATSSLDTENEKIVQEALKKARMSRTTIMIAHRLSTIQDADKIAVLDKGMVVEVGSHLELMNKKGLYYEMTLH